MEDKQKNIEATLHEDAEAPIRHVMTDEELTASLYEEDTPQMSENELQETILEDSGMNAFQKFVARLDDGKWVLYQRIAGAILGILCAVALFSDSRNEGGFSFSLIIAVVIAMAVPNIIEKQSLRKVIQLRIALALSLAVALVAFMVFNNFRA